MLITQAADGEITHLNLRANGLTDSVAASLVDTLLRKPSLATLSLAQNSGVGRETAHALAQLMAQPVSAVGLRTLGLAQVRTVYAGGSAC